MRVAFLVELKTADQLLGQRAARALGKNDDLGAQIVTGLKIAFLLAVLVYTFVVGTYANNTSFFKEKFGSRKSRENGDAGFLDFSSKPFNELIDRDNVVTMIAHRWRRDGELEFAGASEKVNCFLDDFRVERSFFLEAG